MSVLGSSDLRARGKFTTSPTTSAMLFRFNVFQSPPSATTAVWWPCLPLERPSKHLSGVSTRTIVELRLAIVIVIVSKTFDHLLSGPSPVIYIHHEKQTL